MNPEQKTILTRLAVVAGVLVVVVAVIYFLYAPKDLTKLPGRVFPSGQKKAVAAIFRQGTWSIDSNASGRWEGENGGDSNFMLGKPGDTPITGTWSVAEGPSVGVFRDGVFTLLIDHRAQVFTFGSPGDIPVIGDWNGDGRSKIGVFRKGFWLLDLNGNGRWDGPPLDSQRAIGGTPGEIPLVGDWNGDGKSDVAVYQANSLFVIDANGNGLWEKNDKLFALGAAGDIPVVGDWNGDGKTKFGIFHKGFWTLDFNGNFAWDGVTGAGKDKFIAFGGMAGDQPVVGDWNGDGRSKIGIYRNGVWYVDTNGDGILDKSDTAWNFGLPGDIPIVLAPLVKK